jgi:RimJ/RimL family protein N-acetyltransferase
MTGDLLFLRDVLEADFPIFFEYQLDPEANHMAAFTSKDPTDRDAYVAHWQRIMADATTINRTIVYDGQVVGSVSSYEDEGRPEVTYWIGRAYWGRGIATAW